ncbi:ABC transporter permease [Nocardioides pinisoli]|uniref:Polyketide antibiotic transporter n=1 Tax=Nocardioides pinisoli TaxID=2950279 RepID=A0ABT1KXF4_9ACTN|nr:polyketide antibiotic transporter [Nocardioides pinisoli]MCP3421946.1 polyketide antibiotic transporter [Nocardioides pinisoli]
MSATSTTGPATSPAASPVTGVGHLLRLVLRRDRLRLPLWLVGLGGSIVASALAVPPIYDTPEKVAGYARTVGTSPVSYLMSGRQAGLDTIGGIVANEISQVAQLGVCLMVVFLVVRHTRAEEESGRAELLRSTVVGRHAATLAGLVYGVTAALLLAAITTTSMLAADLPAGGSLTYGVGLALLGVAYTAITLVSVQVSTSARGALGLAGAAVAVGYLVRGIGAMQDNALVWLSPFGWAQGMDAFGDERWWPAALLLAFTALLLALAARLVAHRDFGGGLLATRPGPPRASRLLHTPLGLAVRLQRGLLTGWAVGLFLLGVLYGAVIPTVPDLIASNPDMADVVGASGQAAEDALVDAFLAYIFLFMAVVACGFVVASVLRLNAEEEAGRAEVVLATPVSRTSWMAGTTAVALVATAGLTVLMGLGLAVGYAVVSGEWDQVLPQVGGQLAYLPGTLVVGALAVALFGLLPRGAGVAWTAVALVALQVVLGQLLGLPDWVQAISPFWHLAAVPTDDFEVVPVVVLVGIAAALVAAGLWGYRRRDAVAG